jgi:hypothetical protein
MLSQGFKRFDYNSSVYMKVAKDSAIYFHLRIDDMLIAAKRI